MSDKYKEPEKTPEKSTLVDNILRASELAVVDAADSQWRTISEQESRTYNGPARVWMRGITQFAVDTKALDHKRFAGWGVNLGRSYGPRNYFHGVGKGVDKNYPEMFSDKPEILKDNDIEINGSILMKNQHGPEIISQEDANAIADDIATVGLTGEVGYKFTSSIPQETPVQDAPFEYEKIITIADIKDTRGKPMNLKIEVNLGFSDASSKEANVDSAINSQEEAQKTLEEGSLVSTGFTLPRPNRVSFYVTNLDDGPLPADNIHLKPKIEAGLAIGVRALEIVLDKTSENKDEMNTIEIRNRTPREIIDGYLGDNPDFDWIKALSE